MVHERLDRHEAHSFYMRAQLIQSLKKKKKEVLFVLVEST